MNNFFAVIRGKGCKLMYLLIIQCPGGCDRVSGAVKLAPRSPLALTRAGSNLGNATPFREQSRQCDTVSETIRKTTIKGKPEEGKLASPSRKRKVKNTTPSRVAIYLP